MTNQSYLKNPEVLFCAKLAFESAANDKIELKNILIKDIK